MEMNCWERF